MVHILNLHFPLAVLKPSLIAIIQFIKSLKDLSKMKKYSKYFPDIEIIVLSSLSQKKNNDILPS